MGNKVRLGFVPLVDCAIPVVARAMGFADQENIELELVREMSWAAIRDKLSYGVYEAAHLLAGIPIAARLGLGGAWATWLIGARVEKSHRRRPGIGSSGHVLCHRFPVFKS